MKVNYKSLQYSLIEMFGAYHTRVHSPELFFTVETQTVRATKAKVYMLMTADTTAAHAARIQGFDQRYFQLLSGSLVGIETKQQ